MTLEMEHNIDMILVNPSEEERIRSTFTMNGMIKEASLITPCIFVPKGQMMACDRGKAMQIGIKFGGEKENGSGNVQRDQCEEESDRPLLRHYSDNDVQRKQQRGGSTGRER